MTLLPQVWLFPFLRLVGRRANAQDGDGLRPLEKQKAENTEDLTHAGTLSLSVMYGIVQKTAFTLWAVAPRQHSCSPECVCGGAGFPAGAVGRGAREGLSSLFRSVWNLPFLIMSGTAGDRFALEFPRFGILWSTLSRSPIAAPCQTLKTREGVQNVSALAKSIPLM